MIALGEIVVVFGLFSVAAVLLLLVWASIGLGKRASRPRPLKPHFLRLGQVAPGDACPCGLDELPKRSYSECCRPKDVRTLEREVREYLWRRWAKRSYGGRRRIRTLAQRIEDHPMPEVVLPVWVTHPEGHVFPLGDEVLRAWRPDLRRKDDSLETILEDSAVDDIL